MGRPVQMEFGIFASEGGAAPRTGKCAPEARDAIRGPSRGINGAVPAGAPPPKPKLVAAIYAEEADEKGNLRLRKVTTSRWLTVKQVAETLHVCVQAVYTRIELGDLRAHRIGNAIRISSDDFEDYLRRTSTDEDFR